MRSCRHSAGQTALNLASQLHEHGILDELGVELIGASYDAIRRAEDRELFAETMASVGLRVPTSVIATRMQEARAALATGGLHLPVVVRPAFTLGGHGGGFAATPEEFEHAVERGLRESPISQILLEESVAGWGEFELEVIRDRVDNVIVVCSIENVDPMGVHTGDSATVAPAQTLSDREYQALRDASAAVIRAVGVETGGSNVQFALNRDTGELVVIEMNPRVSRSSALASKATGYPIAKVATRLAIGYTLDEIPNDITRTTPAAFEPTLDYVVVKLPRFAFEKFPGAATGLTTQMKSVGEVMGIGRTFAEAWGKAMRSRELDHEPRTEGSVAEAEWDRFDAIQGRLTAGEDPAALAAESGVHPWFVDEWELVAHAERMLRRTPVEGLVETDWRRLKALGMADARIAALAGSDEGTVRRLRWAAGVRPVYKAVDSCAAEVEAQAPYFYSAYELEDELPEPERPTVIILGAGPNRIGQGIEFDYCCVQAVRTFRELGYDAVMVNCNPETVSTDAETSDRLYFEPLTIEDVLEVVDRERPIGVVVMFGGQTPLRLARRLEEAGVPILGTPFAAIDVAEDRDRFGTILHELGLRAPEWGTAATADEAAEIAGRIGYPVLVRPSYVLGGREMRICYDEASLRARPVQPGSLVDRFVEDAIEVDVDAICDGTRTVIGAVMQHVEEAGVHSGDSTCVIPTMSLGERVEAEICRQTAAIAEALGVRGLINVQFAVRGEEVYVLEANPRASRTVPFVSKATGRDLVDAACRAALGLAVDLPETTGGHVSVKAAVLPFQRFAGADPTLGPEMRSTGEVMGIGPDLPTAFAQGRARGGPAAPGRRHRLPLGLRSRQARGADACRAAPVARVRAGRDCRHGARDLPDRHPGGGGAQGDRGLAERGRPHPRLRRPAHHQHPGGPRGSHRRLRDPGGGDRPRHPLHHDHRRCVGGRPVDRAGARHRAGRAPGPARPRGRHGCSRRRVASLSRASSRPAPTRSFGCGATASNAGAPGQFFMLAGRPGARQTRTCPGRSRRPGPTSMSWRFCSTSAAPARGRWRRPAR